MSKFKQGDKLKVIKLESGNIKTSGLEIGDIVTVDKADSTSYYNTRVHSEKYIGWLYDGELGYVNYKKVKVLPPKFILQYEINENQFELFGSLNEVKSRIKELMAKGGHSYKVYEIKKMWTPTVEKKEIISIKGL